MDLNIVFAFIFAITITSSCLRLITHESLPFLMALESILNTQTQDYGPLVFCQTKFSPTSYRVEGTERFHYDADPPVFGPM